jgi:hypothetical protein
MSGLGSADVRFSPEANMLARSRRDNLVMATTHRVMRTLGTLHRNLTAPRTGLFCCTARSERSGGYTGGRGEFALSSAPVSVLRRFTMSACRAGSAGRPSMQAQG